MLKQNWSDIAPRVFITSITLILFGMFIWFIYNGYNNSLKYDKRLNEFDCQKTLLVIKGISITDDKTGELYYVLEHNNVIYHYKVKNITKNINDTIELYVLNKNIKWIGYQKPIIEKCDN